MHGGLMVAKALREQGVTHLFMLCGGHVSPITVGCKELGIHVVDVRDEASAVFAADAYARLTGNVGVALVTAGPGVMNTLTAVKNAALAESPLLVIGGATAVILRGRGSLQDINQVEVMRPNVKYLATVSRVSELVPKVQRAMREAVTGVPGPVFVEVPVDTLYPKKFVREQYGIRESTRGLGQWMLNTYLKRQFNRLFAMDGEPEYTKVRKQLAGVSRSKVSRVAELLNDSQRPVILVGSQALQEVERVPDLSAAVEDMGVPVFLSGMARGLLGRNHRLHMRHKRTKALREADLVILAGTPMDFRLNYGRQINRSAKVVSVNLDRRLVGLNKFFKSIDVEVVGSPSDFLIQLATMGSWEREEWYETLRRRHDDRCEEIHNMAAERPDRYVNPLYVAEAIEEVIDEDCVIIGDGGDFLATVSYVVQPRNPLSWLDPGVFGTLGPGAGFAMAAKLVRPDSEVWLIYGDGSAGYSIIEFDTMVRHGIPVIAVIGNNAGWAQIQRDQVEMLGDDVATTLGYTHYEGVVEALGGRGILVEETEQLLPALKEAKELARKGTPVLVNVLLAPSDFRKGSLSM